ncbi:YgaP family membrane protein [Sphingobacterium paucimobilis]|uniref:Inner membrane protein YgaP-like transmembrane domain-containing protein n=1 Tax=Sphingobacterium paucimobilis HER1398 TaxID=1346330 RepID=U2HHM6_9SPHI|nr:DUF2892 domain-containing protein [Sphingobacterium paucimobilis]ERJ61256.1 hypothetical protein M472_21110 [Sphingobacterium paucimobilis HER1398]
MSVTTKETNMLLNYALEKIKNKLNDDCIDGNVSTSERILSVVAGGLILGIGVKQLIKRPMTALTGVTLGGALVYRGITGHCSIKSTIDKLSKDDNEVTVIEHRYFVKP